MTGDLRCALAGIAILLGALGPIVASAAEPPTGSPPSEGPIEEQAAEAPIDVVVEGEKAPPSVSTLTRSEVRQIPGAFGDPFRAIEALPGVTPIISGLPFFYVRGAPPGNIGYFLDGVRVPYLYHVAIGPSVIHPGLVERVDLYSGGYPARYGRYAGAIVAAETTAPRDDFHGEANLRLYDAGALVEGGFAEGRGTALVGARYSYTAAIFSILAPELHLDYRDYQLRVTYDVTSRDRLGLFAFGSYDLLASEDPDAPERGETILFGSEFYRVDARYDRKLGSEASLRLATTFGFDQTHLPEQRNAQDYLFGARLELMAPAGPHAKLRAGLDAQFDAYRTAPLSFVDPDDPDTRAFEGLFPPRNDSVMGLWADVVWKLGALELTPGVRFDVFRSASNHAIGFDPRLAVRAAVTKRVRLLHALGIAHQPPSFIAPIPAISAATLETGLQTSLQHSAGVEADLPLDTTATVTFFDNVFLDMTDTLGAADDIDLEDPQIPRSLGSARGLEVHIRRRLTRQLGGYLAYTLSRTTRTIGASSFPAAFDRTHVVSGAVGYDLGRGWRAGTRLSFYTGAPTANSIFGAPIPGSSARDPSFFRIDFRLEKRWKLGKTPWISFVIEMLNATLNKENFGGKDVGPVAVPSLGAEGGF